MVKVRAYSFLLALCTWCFKLTSGLHPPQCHWSLVDDLDRLNCRVEPRSSLIVEEEVQRVGPEHAKSLWVTCETDSGGSTDPGFVLSHGVFMAVPHLRDLRLEGCRIAGITPGALSYLPNLQNLSINAHTSQLRPLVPLEVKSGVLRDLLFLQSLDLSTTSLTSLPSDFLCFLPALQHLNFSMCSIREFRSIGILPTDPTNLMNTCGNRIRTLDLSGNYFTLLPPATFVFLNELEELRLDLNAITLAAERALLGLKSLHVLTLAGNQLTSLPPEFFKDNGQLREIQLQNNSLGVLAPGLFSGLEHLTLLDLSNNDLGSEWVTGDTFRGLIRLNDLNLAQNRISRLDAILFNDLVSLQILNLDNNRIKEMSPSLFSGTPNLHTLLLSQNEIKSLDGRICTGLSLLSYIALDNNKIHDMATDTFQNCSNIEDLNLSENKMSSVPEAIRHLTLLRTLDMGENLITEINETSLQGLPSLYGLRLTGNKIQTVAKDSFAQLPSLKIVNLAENNLTTLEAGVFDGNTNLHAIRLDVNKIQNISGLFKNVPNLLWLNISGNGLTELDYAEFPHRLQLLNVQSNRISSLATCIHLDNLRIRTIDISDNQLTEISSANIPDSIQKLILRNNLIESIQPYTFFRKRNLTRIDLSSNRLVKLDPNALRISKSPVEILLGNNPFQCDCSMQWLQPSSQSGQSVQYPSILDSTEVKCSMAFQQKLVQFLHVSPSEFLCKYESLCQASCNCCDYDACDCQLTCPTNCTCYHDDAWSINRVECSSHEMTFVPGRIPMDVTELYLDGNLFPSLEAHAFIGKKKLRSLFLNGSHVETIQDKSFAGLKQLRNLHLGNNFIERLEGFEFKELVNLEELYLQQNSISWIANNTFSRLSKLRVLWLHGNNLVDLRIWSVTTEIGRLGSTLTELSLRGNEWSCECSFATQLKDWLIDYRTIVSDASQVHCVDQVHNSNRASPKSELIVVRILEQPNHRCSARTSDTNLFEEPLKAEESADWSEHVPIILSLATFFLVILFIIFLIYRWRSTLRVWVHAKYGLRLPTCSQPFEEQEKLFDAYVSYSWKDDAWVRDVLAAELERQESPFRLCLRYRDLPASGAYLADTIVQAAEASKRTVIILSSHFLKDEWSRSDVKSAHHSVLKDRGRRVIIVLLGELPSKDLDPDIRLYLKNHTWLSAEDSNFWAKLRYALPDVQAKRGRLSGPSQLSSPQQYEHPKPEYSPATSDYAHGLGTRIENSPRSASHSHYQAIKPNHPPPPTPPNHPPPIYQQYQHHPSSHQRALVMTTSNGRTETVLSSAQRGLPLAHPMQLNSNRHAAIHI